jgi:hypothetical protein
MLAEPTQIRDIKRLKASFRQKVNDIVAALKHEGYNPIVIETFRTVTRQKWLLANDRTWVKHSKHQDGLAADIAFVDLQGKCIWWKNYSGWVRLAHYARAAGCIAGHDWKVRDCPHVEEA